MLTNMRIGWIGLGVMGRSMAGHLLDAGHQLAVHTRTSGTASDLLARGAVWCDSPAEVASDAEVVATMVGHPADVRAVVTGPRGALDAMASGSVLIDFTTSEPSLAREIAATAGDRGVGALDAPVSGGDVGARNASLSIMVGGDTAAFERARPLLDLLGTTVVHQGGPGAGQHTKMVNQILVAGTMMGLCEALLYARRAGLDPSSVFESVGGGAAASWSLANLAPRILEGDLRPGFYVEHFVKDLGIAVTEAERAGLDLPALDLARRLYVDLAAHDGGRLGTQALVVELADRSGLTWP
jgi:3-hydroxyisobutyrate dehydrogenase